MVTVTFDNYFSSWLLSPYWDVKAVVNSAMFTRPTFHHLLLISLWLLFTTWKQCRRKAFRKEEKNNFCWRYRGFWLIRGTAYNRVDVLIFTCLYSRLIINNNLWSFMGHFSAYTLALCSFFCNVLLARQHLISLAALFTEFPPSDI